MIPAMTMLAHVAGAGLLCLGALVGFVAADMVVCPHTPDPLHVRALGVVVVSSALIIAGLALITL